MFVDDFKEKYEPHYWSRIYFYKVYPRETLVSHTYLAFLKYSPRNKTLNLKT